MFGLWGRRPKLVREDDQVFMTRTRADAALCESALAGAGPALVASFFPASLRRIGESLAAAGRRAQTLSSRARPSLPLAAGAGPYLLEAGGLSVDHALVSWLVDAHLPFHVLFVEHYPSQTGEAAALGALEEVSASLAQRVTFYVGLDEPLMQAFGGERVVVLMRQLGMSEHEAIAHPLVNRSIVAAQRKLARRVSAQQPADSDVEWFRIHLGDGPARRG